ncbi:armadillo-type protein [Protomyces lactucae-debilis]|uniref:Armadillo-type protein n=1 Tax=Protomyces lactucae-debilis TaxID=2754530 RepID=A0A1Y2F458_PROLT|nr:armadillo-type protein [Protomyces lactucae-debilis]ORY78643.1 armadillo-type protein [Protomyces lactucae-debilis]
MRTGSKKQRIQLLDELKDVLQANDAFGPKAAEALTSDLITTSLLFSTDRDSKRRIMTLAAQLMSQAPQSTTTTVLREVERSNQGTGATTIASNALILVHWVCVLLESPELPEDSLSAVIQYQAILLDQCSIPGTKEGLTLSARRRTRACLKACLARDGAEKTLAQYASALLGASASPRHAILLGQLVEELQPSASAALSDLQGQLLEYYLKTFLSSKTAISKHSAEGFASVFKSLSLETISEDIVPALIKGLLRAPEVVADPTLTAFIKFARPGDENCSALLADRLAKPLLGVYKSSNANTRASGLAAFKTLLSRTGLSIDELISQLTNAMTADRPGVDQRLIIVQTLQAVPLTASSASLLLDASATLLGKESAEPVQLLLISCLLHALSHQQSQGLEVPSKAKILIRQGLQDKKANIKSQWVCGLADANVAQPGVVDQVIQSLATEFLAVWQADIKAPLQTHQAGLIMSTYALTHLLLTYSQRSPGVLPKSFREAIFATEPCFVFWEKLFSKLAKAEEVRWLHALTQATAEVSTEIEFSLIAQAWAKVVLCLDSQSIVKLKRSTLELTPEKIKIQSQSILDKTIDYARQPVKDSAQFARYVAGGLRASIAGLGDASFSDAAFKDDLLIRMLVIAHMPALKEQLSWVDLIQSAKGDPSELALKHTEELFALALESLEFDRLEAFSQMTLAALNAITTLAFISPTSTIPRVVQLIQGDLSEPLLQLDEAATGIWLAPEGQTYVDVLGKTETAAIKVNKNSKDWATQEWEAQVKQQIAARKALPRTLPKDEKAKVEAQLEKERLIRRQVSNEVFRLRRSTALIRCLNVGTFVEPRLWFIKVIASLLVTLKSPASSILRSLLEEVYLDCASLVSRLGPEARLVGLATLKTFEDSDRTERHDLVNRVLYKLRFESEQSPFDYLSIAYSLPLIHAVLSQQGIACKNDEQIEEQLFLCLEWYNFNSALFTETDFDRKACIQALVTVLETRPLQGAEAKQALQALLDVMAENANVEELQLVCDYCCSSDSNVRLAVLQCAEPLNLSELNFSPELWLATHDHVEQSALIAQTLFRENAMSAGKDTRKRTLPFLESPSAFKRACAARAVASTVQMEPTAMGETLAYLFELYVADATPPPPEIDQFGQVKQVESAKKSGDVRVAVALALYELAPLLQSVGDVVAVSQFFFKQTAATSIPLADPNSQVRSEMLKTATRIVELHGAKAVEQLLPVFEKGLDSHGASQEADWTRLAAVVLFGSAAANLKHSDERIPRVIEQLMATLKTPSESVQLAIAECLPPLVRAVQDQQTSIVDELFKQLTSGASYAERRGAAYALSGVVRGYGIPILKTEKVMSRLESAMMNKKESKARQGALFAYECFAQLLGPLFEPYIREIIPLLLLTFADSSAEVRTATQDTARTIMAQISGFGVKLILPSLLSGLNDTQWRSKKGSVELLGAMAYCAPKQLSISLPTIIPKLTEVLSDSHAQVRNSGNDSLQGFGQVIQNPEVQSLVPTLLKALSDPNSKTESALDAILKTSFLHYIDSPSLALLMPILQRGLNERIASQKKKAAKIFGLMASLTDPNDLTPHLSTLMPCLRNVMVDTIPDVRATAAKALGSLVEKLGERNFPTMVDDLLDTLNADVASTDRQGAAQGLSEVLAGLGLDRLEDTLPRILRDSRSPHAYVREAFISLLIYLPATFGSRFSPYLSQSITPILVGLADDSEFVRDASLRAGKIMIANYATKSVDLMLPELERGIFNTTWRIRVSSLQLIGDLLFKVSGITTSTKTDDEDEEEDSVATEAQRNALIEALGQARRDRILSSIYIARFDTFAMVRSSAINVWKTLVANTPKTVKDILPSMIAIIIENLSIDDDEKRAVFIETLGDLMRKNGEELVLQLLPALEEGLRSPSAAYRIGVCVAMSELISNGTSEQLEGAEDALTRAMRRVLIDDNQHVRAAANKAFDALQSKFGKRVVNAVLPELLMMLQSEDKAEAALAALRGMMQARAQVILPILIPTLTKAPLSKFNIRAIASLSRVAGAALTKRLSSLLSCLLDSEVSGNEAEESGAAFESVLLSTQDAVEAIASIMNIMLDFAKHDDHKKRAAACRHMAVFFTENKLDISRYVQDWLRVLLGLFADSSNYVVEAAWSALDALTKSLRKEEMGGLVAPLRRALQSVSVPDTDLPGFSLPKGLSAVLPIFLQGLMQGNSDQKEESALGLGDVIVRTKPEALKVFVTQITGPLIRIIGERSSSDIKAAILLSLRLLLQRIPASLKPFLPQLQRTFTKSLADPMEAVRVRAAKALGTLITLQTRVDPLVAELVTGVQGGDAQVAEAMLSALFQVVGKAAIHMSTASKQSVVQLVKQLSTGGAAAASGSSDVSGRKAAELLGVLFRNLEDDQARALLGDLILVTPPTRFSMVALNGLLVESADKIAELPGCPGDIATYVCTAAQDANPQVSDLAMLAVGKWLLNPRYHRDYQHVKQIMACLASCMQSPKSASTDTKRLALVDVNALARRYPEIVRPHAEVLLEPIFSTVRDPVLPVKLAGEQAFVNVLEMPAQETALLDGLLAKLEHPAKTRSMGEYAKRVASKIAAAQNEKEAAGVPLRDDDMDEIFGVKDEDENDA